MLTYLCSPYSNSNPLVQEDRFLAACEAAGAMMKAGEHVFSPIAHTAPIANACDLPHGFDYWRGYDETFLAACGRLAILVIDGWRESAGVRFEYEYAARRRMPVRFVDREGEEVLAW